MLLAGGPTHKPHLKLLPEPRLPVHLLVLFLQLLNPLANVGWEERGGVVGVSQVYDCPCECECECE